MKILITLLAVTAILATSADAQTRRANGVRVAQHNNNSVSRNSARGKPVTRVKASNCHFRHGEADPDAQVRLMMMRDCKEHEETE
jgi:hypothetical protein